MYEFVSENLTTILIVAAAVAIVLIILCIVAKLFKIAIGLAILYVVVPIIFTIFWGDGGRYVAKFASFFQPEYQQRIEDVYDYYKQKDAEDPFVNYDAVSNTVTDIFQHAFEAVPQPSLGPDDIQDIDDVQKVFKLSNGERNFLVSATKGNFLLKMQEESTTGFAKAFDYEQYLIERKTAAMNVKSR